MTFFSALLALSTLFPASALLSPSPGGAPVWLNGMNVAWNQFGYDLGAGAFDAAWFEEYFSMSQQNGINSARFWVHCDGRASPSFAADGSVSGLSSTFLPELQQLASLADKHDVVLQLCLWSFDMFKHETATGHHPDLVSDAAKSKSYVDKALVPMLKALEGMDNIIIEVINEPEWAIKGPGNTPVMVDASDMQRFAAMIAEAVHTNSAFKVTVGSASLKWDASGGSAETHYWNDTALQAAYPSQTGVLDMYNVHYYDWMYNTDYGYDPCREPTSYWKLDKPTMVMETPPNSEHYTPAKMLQCAYDNGFLGTAFWSYSDSAFPWKDALPGLKAFAQAHSNISSYSAVKAWLTAL